MRNFSKLLVSVVGVSKAEAAPIAAVLQAVINVVVVMIMVVVVVVVVIVVVVTIDYVLFVNRTVLIAV